ncbi:hypothetical protein F5144DRAFT_144738 [Chaetomium tenue]|uniref:Uncharacterized protein n=1 Tax=Chaetomium tenue TaxID=1854479 RepID=A0ACB7PJB7_9PEZI|nr:hypothetical protein F5144DRAFT_144738 [Chaetomium globosum]
MWSSVGNYVTRFLATIGARGAPKPVEPLTEVAAEEVVLPAFSEAQFMSYFVANDSSSVTAAPAFSLAKRQYCNPGFGYCSSSGGCCPLDTRCCGSGCLARGDVCCPNGTCPQGSNCCGYNNCYPRGSQCCSNGSHCKAGNICVQLFEDNSIVCCTDLRCTAYVEDDGRTIYESTTTRFTTRLVPTTPPPVVTRTQTLTYYYTLTWTYYYYYWTYYISIRASVVTYSARTTRTTLTALATDPSDAGRSFEAMTPTITFTAPASATSLASLEGTTSFDPGFGPSDEPSDTAPAQALTTTTTAGQPPFVPGGGGVGEGGGEGVGGGRVNGATTTKGSGNWLLTCLASVGLGIGMMAVWL